MFEVTFGKDKRKIRRELLEFTKASDSGDDDDDDEASDNNDEAEKDIDEPSTEAPSESGKSSGASSVSKTTPKAPEHRHNEPSKTTAGTEKAPPGPVSMRMIPKTTEVVKPTGDGRVVWRTTDKKPLRHESMINNVKRILDKNQSEGPLKNDLNSLNRDIDKFGILDRAYVSDEGVEIRNKDNSVLCVIVPSQ